MFAVTRFRLFDPSSKEGEGKTKEGTDSDRKTERSKKVILKCNFRDVTAHRIAKLPFNQ